MSSHSRGRAIVRESLSQITSQVDVLAARVRQRLGCSSATAQSVTRNALIEILSDEEDEEEENVERAFDVSLSGSIQLTASSQEELDSKIEQLRSRAESADIESFEVDCPDYEDGDEV